MTYLLEETLEELKYLQKTPEDVDWVGTSDGEYSVTWDEFVEIAKNIKYDAGYGSVYINMQLVVVFKDQSWLEREDYDGAENWIRKKAPKKRKNPKKLTQGRIGGWV